MEQTQQPTGIFFCTAKAPDLIAALGAVQEGMKGEQFSKAEFLQLVVQQTVIQMKVQGSVQVEYVVIAVVKFPDAPPVFKKGLEVN